MDESALREATALVAAISAARLDPAALAKCIRARLAAFKGKDYFPPEHGGKVAVATKEGKAAVEDALAFLAKQAALPAITEPEDELALTGLRLSCEDHLVDRGTLGLVGHTGADGSSAAERVSRYGSLSGATGECLWFGRKSASAQRIVEDLVVDDGVLNRGHRLCIFEPRYAVAAAHLGEHRVFGKMAVIEFVSAGGFEGADAETVARRQATGPPQPVAPSTSSAAEQTQWSGSIGTCRGCGEPIRGGSVMEVATLGKYHKECFACAACATPLAGVPWRPTPAERTDEPRAPYCESCHVAEFALECAGCGQKISGGYVKVGGTPYHKACKPAAAAPGSSGAGASKSAGAPSKKAGASTGAKKSAAVKTTSMAGARAATGMAGLAGDYADLQM